MSPLEKARAARAVQRAARRTVECPSCGAQDVVVLPSAVVSHRCPKLPGQKMTTFRDVAT